MTDGRVTVSSREIAARFGKEHQHVTQSIEKFISENSLVKDWFTEASYISERGRSYKEYFMNRDRFSFLAMGFTGKSAATWKERYINAFNQMEETLRKNQVPMEYEIPQNYAIFW